MDGAGGPAGTAGPVATPLLVQAGPAEHRVHIGPGVVVAVDRLAQPGRVGQVPAAAEAQVPGGAHGGVEQVVGVGHPVAVAVAAQRPPGRGDELHRPDRPVPGRVPVPAAAVAVGDAGHPVAVQGRAGDSRAHRAGRAEPGRGPSEQAVIGLDAADAGQDRPGEPAVRVEPGSPGRRLAVGAEGERGDDRAAGRDHPGGRGGGGASPGGGLPGRRPVALGRGRGLASPLPGQGTKAGLLGGARLDARGDARDQPRGRVAGGQGAGGQERGGRDRPGQEGHQAHAHGPQAAGEGRGRRWRTVQGRLPRACAAFHVGTS